MTRWKAGCALLVGLGGVWAAWGASAAGATTFTNPGAITIPAGPGGAATPYPSSIAVSGIPGPITDVNVRLHAFSHQKPNDIAFVLVAPGGQALLLADGAGGVNPVTNVEFSLDDSAASALPNSPLASGTFKPAAYFTGSNFSPPGPGTAYGHPGPSGTGTATLASTFNGVGANGNWNLFVRNFGGANTGQFASGWSLEISPSPAPAAPGVVPTPTTTTKKKKCKKGKKKRGKRSTVAAKTKCKKKGKRRK